MRILDNWDEDEAECGFPNKFVVMALANPSIKDFAYGVVPA
jgi:hypothetical protein